MEPAPDFAAAANDTASVSSSSLISGASASKLPLWAKLLALVAFNVVGVGAVLRLVRAAGDNSEPLCIVKLQVGLLERHPQLQHKLTELMRMKECGQQGVWLILEDAILELTKHKAAWAYAGTQVVPLTSKKQAYDMFSELADRELGKAAQEEAAVKHHSGLSDIEDEGMPLFGLGRRNKPVNEAMVVTLVVAARGRLQIEEKLQGWQDVRHAMQQLSALTSSRIMAVELLWTPQDEDDYLTKEQLVQDYPMLQPLK